MNHHGVRRMAVRPASDRLLTLIDYRSTMRHLLTFAVCCLVAVSCCHSRAVAQPFVDGIDVSVFQGNINWNTVRNSGVEYSFIKATEGVGFVDSRFTQNIQGATSAGVLAGPYHYARPDSSTSNPLDAVNEANHFLSQIEPYYDTGMYLPPVLDVEEFDLGLSISQTRSFISNWVQDFSDTVQNSLGVRPVIYASQSAANTYFTSTVASQHDLWVAWWKGTGTTDPPLQSDNPNWNLWEHWQYTATGSVPGIAGDVDLDVFNGTRQELEATLIGQGSGGLGGPTVIESFDVDEGYFGWNTDFSGSNQNIGEASTAERVTTEAQDGAGSQEIFIDGDNSGWFYRHVSGIGSAASAAGNLAFDTTGYIGFWLKTNDSGLAVQLAIDAPDTADRGVAKDVIADGEWHLYEWNLDDNSEWGPWVNGDGVIDAATATIDSIQFTGAGQATFFLDSVAHNPEGSLMPTPLLPGDFNDDGVVNIADYAVWRDNLGAADETVLNNNGDGGGVTAADYTVWKDNFGQTSDAASGFTLTTVVPESSACALAVLLLGGCVCLGWRPDQQ